MAVLVVDLLEVVEIGQDHLRGAVLPAHLLDLLARQPQELHPVEEAGQSVARGALPQGGVLLLVAERRHAERHRREQHGGNQRGGLTAEVDLEQRVGPSDRDEDHPAAEVVDRHEPAAERQRSQGEPVGRGVPCRARLVGALLAPELGRRHPEEDPHRREVERASRPDVVGGVVQDREHAHDHRCHRDLPPRRAGRPQRPCSGPYGGRAGDDEDVGQRVGPHLVDGPVEQIERSARYEEAQRSAPPGGVRRTGAAIGHKVELHQHRQRDDAERDAQTGRIQHRRPSQAPASLLRILTARKIVGSAIAPGPGAGRARNVRSVSSSSPNRSPSG